VQLRKRKTKRYILISIYRTMNMVTSSASVDMHAGIWLFCRFWSGNSNASLNTAAPSQVVFRCRSYLGSSLVMSSFVGSCCSWIYRGLTGRMYCWHVTCRFATVWVPNLATVGKCCHSMSSLICSRQWAIVNLNNTAISSLHVGKRNEVRFEMQFSYCKNILIDFWVYICLPFMKLTLFQSLPRSRQ
jgi:hypothetical protein